MGPFFCAICRQTDFNGKGHVFGKSHQAKLKVVIVKFLEKVKEARRTIKNPQVEKFSSTEHQCNFWCYCCELEVAKHVSNGNLTVMFGGLLEHMSTQEHRKSTHKFWWQNKADQKLRDKFIISSEDIDRFKEEVAKAIENFEDNEDVLIKEQAAVIRAQEQYRAEVLNAALATECNAELEQTTQHAQQEAEIFGGSCYLRSQGQDDRAGPSWRDPGVESQWADEDVGLTFIGHQDSSGSGNVHTGAVPPWMQDDPEEGSSKTQEIGPSLQEFMKQKEQEKLKKLPPNRVGANFDHTSHTDTNWLPSFGRVWNNGRRWQSRHQFRDEEGKGSGRKRKAGSWGKGGKKTKKSNHTDLSEH
ncbi:coiled-coil domain-containing protein 84 [Engraulis encrasicolus]|uniref:coiled-coil domain-containing protein 84 n=1 Tax=Engraulis encrasicolus TaxID=184585 RepID=UPI002FD1466E